MDKVIHVKAFMDRLVDEDGQLIIEEIIKSIPYKYDDDVFEFDIILKNIKDITDIVGVDDDGCRAFTAVEVTS